MGDLCWLSYSKGLRAGMLTCPRGRLAARARGSWDTPGKGEGITPFPK